jgi:hypothetical protein
MGRIVALEDLVLAGRTFRLALTGEPYTGKTEVGALVARIAQAQRERLTLVVVVAAAVQTMQPTKTVVRVDRVL